MRFYHHQPMLLKQRLRKNHSNLNRVKMLAKPLKSTLSATRVTFHSSDGNIIATRSAGCKQLCWHVLDHATRMYVWCPKMRRHVDKLRPSYATIEDAKLGVTPTSLASTSLTSSPERRNAAKERFPDFVEWLSKRILQCLYWQYSTK